MSCPAAALTALLDVMARLRDPTSGCRWDLAQDFRSIAPFTLEEAYEVADAIARDDRADLRDELGDLLFQVVFHARLAEERGWFDFADVAASIHDKLVRRHPHVFSSNPEPLDGTQLETLWEEQKARERAAAGAAGQRLSALADVPLALPALTRAAKLGRRAARVGFDWQHARNVRPKVMEELAEFDAALGADAAEAAGAAEPSAQMVEEFGDLMFALVNWGRHLRIDAEAALREANRKFERRFECMEALALARGLDPQALSPQEWEALWNTSKALLAEEVQR